MNKKEKNNPTISLCLRIPPPTPMSFISIIKKTMRHHILKVGVSAFDTPKSIYAHPSL
tara:strand:- start:120 stop:293 length:174 start_codon:yes stop_codon:yes gene_type:complete